MLLWLVRIEVASDSSCRLVVLGYVVRRWPAEEFSGWGTPLAMLFTRDWIVPRAEPGKERAK